MDNINRLLASTAKRPQLILMDNSTSTNESEKHPYPVQTSVPLTILVAILILLTVFGNVMVVIAVNTSRALRAPQNLFLVSLACADILVATLVIPFSLVKELMGYWYFGKEWCVIHSTLDVFFCTASIFHLCAISLDRYWSITQAIEYNLKRTPRRIKCTIVIVWVLAAIISFPPLITDLIKHESDENSQNCDINKEPWYIIFSCTASFFAPCIIMITVYVRIYHVAIKRTREPPGERQREYGNAGNQERTDTEGEVDGGNEINVLDVEEEPSSSDGNDTILCSMVKKRGTRATKVAQVKPGETSPTPEAQTSVRVSKWKARQYRERRFTFVLAVVMGVFVLCWFPFFFTYTLTALCTCSVPDILFTMFFWFGYCNSSLNPIIYTIFNKDFSRSFRKILCKRCNRGL